MDVQPKTRKESKKSAKEKKAFYSARYARQKVSMLETNALTSRRSTRDNGVAARTPKTSASTS